MCPFSGAGLQYPNPEKSMTRILQHRLLYRGLTLAFLFLVTLSLSAEWAAPQEQGGVPAYNAGPPPKGTKLPPTLAKSDLWGADAQYPYQTHAYRSEEHTSELQSRVD